MPQAPVPDFNPDPPTLRSHNIASKWNVAFLMYLWLYRPGQQPVSTLELLNLTPRRGWMIEPREQKRLTVLGVLPVEN